MGEGLDKAIRQVNEWREWRFPEPEDAKPNFNAVMYISPTDKYNRVKGMSAKENAEFCGICDLGSDTLIACYHSVWDTNAYFTPSDFYEMCKDCPHCFATKAGYDPYYRSIFNGQHICRLLRIRGYYSDDDPKAFVYFISDGAYVKIGSAADPQKRLGGIQTGNPNPVEILYLIPCENRKDASEAESYLHTIYSYYRRSGEWFDILGKIHKPSFESYFSPKWYLGSDEEVEAVG